MQAVRASCTVGQIPSAACRASFASGNHEHITDEILKLIDNGAKCSRLDPAALRSEMQQRAGSAASGSAGPAAHYLCVCLGGHESSAKCLAAVRAACLVGDIPAGDCAASLEGGHHDSVTDHVLRLIDNGGRCSERYQPKAKPPAVAGGVGSWFSGFGGGGDAASAEAPALLAQPQHRELCFCLDDPASSPCRNAIRRACKTRQIPKEDCDVAMNADFWAGASRHALRLIDHGAECPAHRSMTFTNRGCHCLQSWKENGKTYNFPNNCADPGGKRGYAWCRTYADEACAGVEGSVEWDRCDQPRLPVLRGVEGEAGDPDSFLCVCVEDGVQDEVCVAAVKAACQVGHLPSAACQASFAGDHKAVSDLVVKAIEGGAKCGLSQIAALKQPQQAAAAASQASSAGSNGDDAAKCNFGSPTLAGGCQCREGYAGDGCNACAIGYHGYPDCRAVKPCPPSCGRGTCEPVTGLCVCPRHFVGDTCELCAPGTSGRNCASDDDDGGPAFGQVLAYVMLAAALAYAARVTLARCCGAARCPPRWRGRGAPASAGQNGYVPVNGAPASFGNGKLHAADSPFDDDDFEAGIEVPAVSSSAVRGVGDADKAGKSPSDADGPVKRAAVERNGLAV